MNKSLEDCYKVLNIISETCDKINTCKDCPFEKKMVSVVLQGKDTLLFGL